MFLIGFQLIILELTQRHFVLTSNEQVNLNLDDLIVKTSRSEKLLGINIDNFLIFNEHVSKLCKKASQKLRGIGRISSYLNKNKKFFCPSLDIVHLSGCSIIEDTTTK